MADKGRSVELPQRVRAAGRAGGPVSPVSLALPEELRGRIHAAVTSELTDAADGDQERAWEDRTTGTPSERRPSSSPDRRAVWPVGRKSRGAGLGVA